MLNQEIIRLIEQGAKDQNVLLEKLKQLGYKLTQSTISRKLKALGYIKINGEYQAIGTENLENKVTFVPPNLIIINTKAGYASAIASKIDQALIITQPEFVGSIAGDDTVFIAVNIVSKTPESLIEQIKLVVK